MADLYFKSEWVPRMPTKDGWRIGGILVNVAHIALEHNCFASYAHHPMWITRANKCKAIPFLWTATSEQQLNRCLKAISNSVESQIAFDDLQMINETKFRSYFSDADDIQPIYLGIGGGLQVDDVLHFENIAEDNESILIR